MKGMVMLNREQEIALVEVLVGFPNEKYDIKLFSDKDALLTVNGNRYILREVGGYVNYTTTWSLAKIKLYDKWDDMPMGHKIKILSKVSIEHPYKINDLESICIAINNCPPKDQITLSSVLAAL